MGIILKYTLKSIKEKKMRTFLIILAISLSVALTFASLALKDSITNTFTEMIKKYLGTANLLITASKDSASDTIRLKPLGDDAKLFDYQIGSIEASATYKTDPKAPAKKLSIRGYETEDLQKLGVVKLTSTLDEPFIGKSIYLSQKIADQNGWQLGDTIDLTINGNKQKVRITGLGLAEGALSMEGATGFSVMPTAALQQIFDMQDKYMFILAKSADGVLVPDAIKILKTHYGRSKVEEPVPWDDISQMLNNIIIPFLFMLLLVLATSVFIIYTAFKVIVAEKLPVLGTFRSIGATKRTTDIILLIESVIYGIIGAILGLWLGQIILNLMGTMMAQGMMGDTGTPANTTVAMPYFIFSGAFAVVLSVLSALIPILQVSKISVRDIVLGSIQKAKENRLSQLLIALVLMVTSMTMPFVIKGAIGVPLSGLSTIMLCVSLVLLAPFFTNFAVSIIEKVIPFVFGNIGVLAVKNIRGNNSILNNISLLTLGIAGILLINTISYSVGIDVLKFYKDAKYQVSFSTENMSRQTIQTVKGIRGVEDAYGTYGVYGIEVPGKNVKISGITGIENMDYFDYWKLPIVSDPTLLKDSIGKTRSIILSTILQKKLGVQLGDTIPLKFSPNVTRDYQVVGLVDTLMNNGSFALATGSFIKRDGSLTNYSDIMIKSVTPDATKAALEKRFKHQSVYAQTMAEMELQNQQSNAMIFNLLQGFSGVAMVIGIFGILNNFVVSLLSRQRAIAVMKSVGMSRKQTVGMLTVEALISGLIGGTLAVAGAVLLVAQIGVLLNLIDLPVKLYYSPPIFITGFVAGGLISMVSNILPAIKTSKLSIVQAIKFE